MQNPQDSHGFFLSSCIPNWDLLRLSWDSSGGGMLAKNTSNKTAPNAIKSFKLASIFPDMAK